MPNAKKLPSGSYRVQLYVGKDKNGKRIVKSFTAPTKKEAERLANQYEYTEGNDLSVSKAIERFIELKSNILSPSSIRGYRTILNRLTEAYPDIAYIVVDKLTDTIMQDFINELSSTHTPKTVKNYYALITSATGKRYNVTLPKIQAIDYVIPTDDDVSRIIEQAQKTEMYVPVLLGAFGMMRRSEICALELSDINTKDCVIHINKAQVRNDNKQWIIKQPKTYSSDRYVNVPQFVIDAIIKNGKITDLTPNLITDRFDRICRRLGMKYRFHDLRHYSASVRHAIGIPDVYIMEEGGWNNDFVLKKIYRNSLEDYKKKMIELSNKHFEDVAINSHIFNDSSHDIQHGKEKTLKNQGF